MLSKRYKANMRSKVLSHANEVLYMLAISILATLLLCWALRKDWFPAWQGDEEKALFKHPTTLVTAYYPLETGSKHTLQEYATWISNLFAHTRTPIVAYLPPGNMTDTIKAMRGRLPLTIKTVDLWDIPPAKTHRTSLETEQHAIDPEKSYHSPALYAIWGSKSWMLQQVAKANPYGSETFFWVDAGSWRARPYPSFPDVGRVQDVFHDAADRMLVGAPVLQSNGKPYIQGTFFGGSRAAVDWWTQEYYRLLDEWIGKSRFAGKDQDLMIDIFERQPQRFLLLQSHGNAVGDPWFFFQPFLANEGDMNEHERSAVAKTCMHDNADDCLLVMGEKRLHEELKS